MDHQPAALLADRLAAVPVVVVASPAVAVGPAPADAFAFADAIPVAAPADALVPVTAETAEQTSPAAELVVDSERVAAFVVVPEDDVAVSPFAAATPRGLAVAGLFALASSARRRVDFGPGTVPPAESAVV